MVPIYIPQVDFSIEALVDSGANISIFHPDLASRLGLKINKGKPIDLTGVGGRIKAYLHSMELEIGSERFMTHVAFSEDFKVSLNILGRRGVFEHFRITFNERQKQVILVH